MTRPRALALTTRLPWPLDDGGRIAAFQNIEALASAFDTTLVSLVPPGGQRGSGPARFTEMGVRLVCVAHRPAWMPFALVRGTFGRWPYMLERYRNRALDATIRREVAERRPDFAFVNALHLTTYLDALGTVPVILRTQNLEYLWLRRLAARTGNPLVRAFVLDQAARMHRVEAERCARCRLVLAIRDEERAELRAIAPGTRVETLPVAVNAATVRERRPEMPPVVALIASWEWAPNVDGARAFLAEGWPRVRARVPGARLRVVGKALGGELEQLARRVGAEPVGYVDDVSVEFARASVLAVPLWMGAGVRVKIVEALAARVPVVTTPMGAEGLGIEPGRHAVFADTPAALGDAIANLLADPARAGALADAGAELARERFSPANVRERTVALCREVIKPEHDAQEVCS